MYCSPPSFSLSSHLPPPPPLSPFRHPQHQWQVQNSHLQDLLPQGERTGDDSFTIPRLGRHYVEVWAGEDGVLEDLPRSAYRQKPGAPGCGRPQPSPDGMFPGMGPVEPIEYGSVGRFTHRLVQALVPERKAVEAEAEAEAAAKAQADAAAKAAAAAAAAAEAGVDSATNPAADGTADAGTTDASAPPGSDRNDDMAPMDATPTGRAATVAATVSSGESATTASAPIPSASPLAPESSKDDGSDANPPQGPRVAAAGRRGGRGKPRISASFARKNEALRAVRAKAKEGGKTQLPLYDVLDPNELSAIDPQLIAPASAPPNMMELEQRVRLELAAIGLLQEPWSATQSIREDDEICVELRRLQKRLTIQIRYNNEMKASLYSTVCSSLPEEDRLRRIKRANDRLYHAFKAYQSTQPSIDSKGKRRTKTVTEERKREVLEKAYEAITAKAELMARIEAERAAQSDTLPKPVAVASHAARRRTRTSSQAGAAASAAKRQRTDRSSPSGRKDGAGSGKSAGSTTDNTASAAGAPAASVSVGPSAETSAGTGATDASSGSGANGSTAPAAPTAGQPGATTTAAVAASANAVGSADDATGTAAGGNVGKVGKAPSPSGNGVPPGSAKSGSTNDDSNKGGPAAAVAKGATGAGDGTDGLAADSGATGSTGLDDGSAGEVTSEDESVTGSTTVATAATAATTLSQNMLRQLSGYAADASRPQYGVTHGTMTAARYHHP